MGINGQSSLKRQLGFLKSLFTTSKVNAKSFFSMAVTACAIKFVVYVLTQTIFPIGTPVYTRLSLDGDMISLGIALLAMCRARDAGTRGLYGFLGSILSFYGVAFFLFRVSGLPIDVLTIKVIGIVPQVTQLIFVWWMSRRSSATPSLP